LGTACLDNLGPAGGIGVDVRDQFAALGAELEEETAECGFMASVVGPDQALTVDNDHQLKLAFAEAVLVDPDPSQPG
jgi:hypothetical protein